jgi:pimeloyl-ACP methyl ester carboxylesterase
MANEQHEGEPTKPGSGTPDASRACEPSIATSLVRNDGVRIAYEVYGEGEPTLVLLPSSPIIHSRQWKAQIPFLSRHYRVVTYDGRGNGRSDRPTEPQFYQPERIVGDLLAVLDATGAERPVLVGLCYEGVWTSIQMAAQRPERVLGIVAFGTGHPALAPHHPWRGTPTFNEPRSTDEGWHKENRHFWLRDYPAYVEFFFHALSSEPHSTKQIEDAVRWGHEGSVDAMLAFKDSGYTSDRETVEATCRSVRCPILVAHGTEDHCQPLARSQRLAELTGAELVVFDGGDHMLPGRHPVKVNLLIRDFVERLSGGATSTPARTLSTFRRALARPRRVLYLSSPIGLGHARRDVAIADELRVLRPDLEIDWLTQDPVTKVLESRGERIHPASHKLASESAHFAAEACEHDLNAFEAIRRMDEVLVANFMLFNEVVDGGEYDLVVGDEAWDVDHFLHENPDLKRTAFAWMTDFVGWLPMPEGGEREAALTADYNLEMIEHVERFPRLRDHSIFVGQPDDIVPDTFGPNLPSIRAWTERHYGFSGYITGFDPAPLIARREELRRELGYQPDERVVLVTVGGSGVGTALLRRVLAAYPEARRLISGLRMIAIAGPRIDPGTLKAPPGVEVRGYVPQLHEHLVACDLAVVQGGLTTTMELVAARRPFLYFPLRRHFEQCRHVRHRLERYGAGRCMDYSTSTPEMIAEAMAQEIDRPISCRPVEYDGARRAAGLIAALL